MEETTDSSILKIGNKSLHPYTQQNWDNLAAFYASEHGKYGNTFHKKLVSPTAEKLLNIRQGVDDLILELGCGSGVFSRRMCELGAKRVIATDFSQNFLDIAARGSQEYKGNLHFAKVDVTIEKDFESLAAGFGQFDKAVCNMALMDISDLDPMFRGLRKVLKDGGSFIFTVMHPCFNGLEMVRALEEIENPSTGEIEIRHYVKIGKYLSWTPSWGKGMLGQPEKQLYFHRPIHELSQTAFKNGFVIDGLEEPKLEFSREELLETEWKNKGYKKCIRWENYTDFPMVLGIRCRKMEI